MKKSLALLNTPARAVIAVGMIIIVFNLLIMMVIEDVFPLSMHKLLYLFDPILLIAIVSPTLYFLILWPMRAQQFKLEQQLDEVRRFQRLSIGRELRMKELVKEIDALRSPLSVEPADNAQLPSGSLEVPRHSAEQPAATQPIEESQRNALLFMLEDLEAGRKKIEQAHQEWVAALDVVNDPIFLHDRELRILRCNKAYQQCAGMPFDELIGQPYYEVFPKATGPLPCCLRAMEKAEEEKEEEEEVAVGGSIYLSRAYSIHDEQGAYLYSVHILTDITERKLAEAAIQHANRALATLSAVNHNLVHASSEDVLLQAICKTIVEQRGYRLAWVGYAQYDESKSIKIMAISDPDEDYPEVILPTWAESELGMGPSGRAIRSGATQVCQDIANDPLYRPWRDEALKRGYAASIAMPLLNEGNTVIGNLTVYATEVNAFTPVEIDLLEEMVGNLAFGVLTLHTRHERDLALIQNKEQLVQLVFQNEEKEKRAAELVIANKELVFQNEEKEKRAAELTIANKKLQDSLEDTVRAIATIGEMRDPYTSGHQVRVADLAAAIAKQLGLHDEQVHAIHLAGMVHDLGKIKIPVDILSKPGRITDIEFSLIKVHPQAGYDILKGIDFPWPIAQMVLQHHERLDGSGYPQGLKGDDILLEARILSVADVVEAMSSHRPYRPGLGIEVALAEITKQRGIYFDPQVVDVCLALFREQHYSFKS